MARPTELTGQWLKLLDAYGGSVEKLTDALAIDRMTLWRWARDGTPAKALKRITDDANFATDRLERFQRALKKL